MKKWEYLKINLSVQEKSLIDTLNEYGELGWELVIKENNILLLKREKQ